MPTLGLPAEGADDGPLPGRRGDPAGDAFYLPPGHVPAAEAGTEFVQFSPATELAAVMAALQGDAAGSEG